MRPEHAAAFERQLEWLRWHASPDAEAMWRDAPIAGIKVYPDATRPISEVWAAARDHYRRPLLYGEVFYTSPRILDWLERIIDDHAVDNIALDPHWAPAEHGFVVFGRPVDLSRGAGRTATSITLRYDGQTINTGIPRTVQAYAMGWSPSAAGLQIVFYAPRILVELNEAGHAALAKHTAAMRRLPPESMVDVTIDERHTTGLSAAAGYYPIAWFEVRSGHTARAEMAEYRRVGDAMGIGAADVDRENADHEIALTYAFLMFVNDRRVRTTSVRADRATRRRRADLKERPPHEHVVVVVLRAEELYERDGRDPNLAPMPRDYTCRWNVRGHMRRHPRTGLKTVEVKPYVKGPADKPFKDDQRRLFSVER
jgi:hypothetical protein